MRTVKTSSGATAVQVVWSSQRGSREIEHFGSAHDEAELETLKAASLVLYDVSTLYFETDQGDGLREPGFSKERRVEPQITIGLLTGQDGFPLMVSAFEGNKAETKTMVPVIEKFMAARNYPDVTVIADAGMISEANQKPIEAAGLSFIFGMKIPHILYVVEEWRRQHPGEEVPDGHVFFQSWPAGPSGKRRDRVIYYQFRVGRARRTLRGIDEQVAKAAKAVAGLASVLAVSRWIEARTGWSIRKFVKTARRYRTIEIKAGRQTITATTSAEPSKPSPTATEVRTSLSQLRFPA
jgi:Transposase DDE domain